MASGVGNENLVRFLEQQQHLNERLAEQQATLLRANSAANVMHNELPKIHSHSLATTRSGQPLKTSSRVRSIASSI